MQQENLRALQPIRKENVHINDSFWNGRIITNRRITLFHVLDELEKAGTVDNFRIAAGCTAGQRRGRPGCDADLYKWLEAAGHSIAADGNACQPEGNTPPASPGHLSNVTNEIVEVVAASQDSSGYINTYFTLVEPTMRLTNLSQMHELYCAGHLILAGIAHERAIGNSALFEVARRKADYLCSVFGFAEGKRTGAPGHQCIEMALVELYRCVGEPRYLELARLFVNVRGTAGSGFESEFRHIDSIGGPEKNREAYRRHLSFARGGFGPPTGRYNGEYLQDHAPVREQSQVVGHSVRALYLYCGMADVALETGDDTLLRALRELWNHMVSRRMYITGGLGDSHVNEGWTEDFELPNETAHAETCSAIANFLWNHRMLQLTGHGDYADTAERALYNGFLAGVSLDGAHFFYANPLERRHDLHPLSHVNDARFTFERQPWFDTPCCPTNAVRFLASLGDYVYLTNESRVVAAFYVSSTLDTEIDGTPVTLRQESHYPWSGTVSFSLECSSPVTFELALRIPGWCKSYEVRVADELVHPDAQNGFILLNREWSSGDTVTLDMEMPVYEIFSHPSVKDNVGKVALQRGPILYCMEEADNECSVHMVYVDRPANWTLIDEHSLGDSVVSLSGWLRHVDLSECNARLYRYTQQTDQLCDVSSERVQMRAVPYFAWGQREPGPMAVWLPKG